MEQTPQPGNRQEDSSKISTAAGQPEESDERHDDPEKHVITSKKKINLSDEDQAVTPIQHTIIPKRIAPTTRQTACCMVAMPC